MLYRVRAKNHIVGISTGRIRWAVHEVSMGGEVHTRFWFGNHRRSDHLKDLGIDGRIIKICIFKKWDAGPGMEFIWLRIWRGG